MNVQLFLYAAVLLTETKVFRSFLMLSLNTCRLQLISLQSQGTDEDGNEVERHSSDEEPFSALVFKIMADPFVGKLAFFRVYSGTMNSGSYVLNATKGKKERVGRILQMHANKTYRNLIKFIPVISLLLLVSNYQQLVIQSVMNSIRLFWNPWNSQNQLSSSLSSLRQKLVRARWVRLLAKLAEEDPTFRAHTDQETGQTIIAGMGELHLEIIVDRLLT